MLRMPAVQGLIRRRILVNFRVDPEVIQRLLPSPFRPKLLGSSAVAGVCLIRLEQIRPSLMPVSFGLSSENAAHRVAVVWDEDGRTREGVWIPRRDSSSLVARLAGGRLFPGEHHAATFMIDDRPTGIKFSMRSADGATEVRFQAVPATELPTGSHFRSLAEASTFFARGSLGYSATRDGRHLDGLTLRIPGWQVKPLQVNEVYSSYFVDPTRFPAGSVAFDCALIMRDAHHEWRSERDLYSDPGSAA